MNPVTLFEQELAEYLGSPYVATVNSGTAALHTAGLATGIRYGDYVITTPYTYPPTANTILMMGAIPVFVDVDESNLLDPEKVEQILRTGLGMRVRAVLPVHLFGRSCDMDAFLALKDRYGVKIIEDASQGFGAEYKGKKLGTFGDAGTYSFYATKNLPAYQGGAIATPHKDVYQNCKYIRRHGMNEDGVMVTMGYNYEIPYNNAFHGWQYLKLHKTAIEAELGTYDESNGYYKYLVYEHPWYQDNKGLWVNTGCPNAESSSKRVRETCA